jgi:hypothetical protein
MVNDTQSRPDNCSITQVDGNLHHQNAKEVASIGIAILPKPREIYY